ncbi:MAG: caspase family protein [Pseudomonadota bacterium]
MFRIVAFLILSFSAPAAWAEQSAILIGISDYSDASRIPDLKGPANDVTLLRRVLSKRGVKDIKVLADGVDGAEIPTRAAILEVLAEKAASVAPGDFVYIHFSGHGTQQPDTNGDETDGLDEVLLPTDAGPAKRGKAAVENGLTDDDLGAAIDLIVAAGAKVWLVIDSCHAGSGLRSGSDRVADRYVSPARLGLPSTPTIAPTEGFSDRDLPANDNVVAFYAAQSSERAREVDLSGDGAPAEWYGLFTARLAAQLSAKNGQSFRQLFQATFRELNDSTTPGAARLQTPSWEGGLIDAGVMGGEVTVTKPRYELRDGIVLAGRIHGFIPGSLVGLLKNAADPEDAMIGFAQVEETATATAALRLVSADCAPEPDTLCESTGELPSEARFVQPLGDPLDPQIVFAAPLIDSALLTELQAGLAELGGTARLGTGTFDVAVTAINGALWFGPRPAVSGHPVGLRWAPGDGPLAPILDRIVKAEMLVKRLSTLNEPGTRSRRKPPVTVTASVKPVPVSALAEPGDDIAPGEECTEARAKIDPANTADLASGQRFKQCDRLEFLAASKRKGPYDVNRVHIDTSYCVRVGWTRLDGKKNAAKPGPNMTMCSDCPSGYSAGDERLFFIVSKAERNSPALKLKGLVETCDRQKFRSGRDKTVDDFLASLGTARLTRGKLGRVGVTDIWVSDYRWTILPRPVAFAENGRALP